MSFHDCSTLTASTVHPAVILDKRLRSGQRVRGISDPLAGAWPDAIHFQIANMIGVVGTEAVAAADPNEVCREPNGLAPATPVRRVAARDDKRKRTDDLQYVTLQRPSPSPNVHIRDRRLKSTGFMGLLQAIHRHKIAHARCATARLSGAWTDAIHSQIANMIGVVGTETVAAADPNERQAHWFGGSRLGTTSYSEPSAVKRKRTDDLQRVTLPRHVQVQVRTFTSEPKAQRHTGFMSVLQGIHRHKIAHAGHTASGGDRARLGTTSYSELSPVKRKRKRTDGCNAQRSSAKSTERSQARRQTDDRRAQAS
ncbi:hypothetical protein B0H14DRAFT_3690919 [Mycena olivaceomarginata]|nr:hypothetical protein B0H14DRAFT_3690919 [Mycena olivaceomarginata]